MVIALDFQRSGRLFRKLLRVAPALREMREHAQLIGPGALALTLDILKRDNSSQLIALGQYWTPPDGRVVPDPDMWVAVFFDLELVEAMTYQDTFTYEQSYPDEDEAPDLAVHTRLNTFLERWLDQLIEQGCVLPIGC